MPEQDEDVTTEETAETEETGTGGQDGDGLGDKGREALKKEREARRAEAKARKAAEVELAALKAQQSAGAEQDEAKKAVDQARRDAEAGVLAKAKDRVNASRAEALAAGKLANPELAVKLLDLSEFEVGDDFGTDDEGISEAISDLIKKYPGLAAKAQGFQGSGDGGARTGGGRAKQLTGADLKTMSAVEISKARQEGRLDRYLSGD